MIDEAKKSIISKACDGHRLVTLFGEFRRMYADNDIER